MRWRSAIKRALARAGSDIDKGLDKVADRLVAAAQEGKPWAIEHIAERFDGKAVQHVSATVEHTVTTGDAEDLKGKLDSARQGRTEHSVQ
jgi:hypothetical protein